MAADTLKPFPEIAEFSLPLAGRSPAKGVKPGKTVAAGQTLAYSPAPRIGDLLSPTAGFVKNLTAKSLTIVKGQDLGGPIPARDLANLDQMALAEAVKELGVTLPPSPREGEPIVALALPTEPFETMTRALWSEWPAVMAQGLGLIARLYPGRGLYLARSPDLAKILPDLAEENPLNFRKTDFSPIAKERLKAPRPGFGGGESWRDGSGRDEAWKDGSGRDGSGKKEPGEPYPIQPDLNRPNFQGFRLLAVNRPYPLTFAPFLRRLLNLGYDRLGPGVLDARTVYLLGRIAQSGRPPLLWPISVQGQNYLAPLGLKPKEALNAVSLEPRDGDAVVLGGLIRGYPVARLNDGLGSETADLRLVRAKSLTSPGPCRGCRNCRLACPLKLPIDVFAQKPLSQWPALAPLSQKLLADCPGCGQCSLSCPARRPLRFFARGPK
jgi:ferredoxin